jgi:hypothetical protein
MLHLVAENFCSKTTHSLKAPGFRAKRLLSTLGAYEVTKIRFQKLLSDGSTCAAYTTAERTTTEVKKKWFFIEFTEAGRCK